MFVFPGTLENTSADVAEDGPAREEAFFFKVAPFLRAGIPNISPVLAGPTGADGRPHAQRGRAAAGRADPTGGPGWQSSAP